MRFYKIKRDPNDKLYSEIIRFGKTRCERCGCVRDLQCAHIIGRRKKSVRFLVKPKPNAIALCAVCHSWLDEHKMWALIFDENKRVFNEKEESFTFLVKCLGYTWDDLQKLYVKGNETISYNEVTRRQINIELKEYRAELLERKGD